MDSRNIVFCLLVIFSVSATTTHATSCGHRPGTRIISGQEALPHTWPWMVQISYQNRHHCGGTLVSPKWIVTAAHCVDYMADKPDKYFELRITLGEHQRSVLEGKEQIFDVKRIVVHPQYDIPRNTINNDIALIELDRPAKLNNQVSLACLPPRYRDIPSGKICYATGWGLTVPGDWTSQADILQQALLPVVSASVCKANYKPVNIAITNSMMCTGYGGNSPISTCNSDSGGPIVCKGADGRWYLEGVVSFGIGGCKPGYYSVNAKVSQLVGWINQYV